MSPQTMLVLASNSPRRRELIALGGWMFHVISADIDERILPGESAEQYVRRMAKSKAQTVAPQVRSGSVVIGVDTIVVDNGDTLGKPVDMTEAEAMLRRLRGRTHQVYTALAVYVPAEDRLEEDLCVTDVPMRDFSDEELRAYVATGDPLDKAGGYAIQHRGFRPVEHLEGCYASVVGLPLCHLVRTLKKVGIMPLSDVPRNCQRTLHYQCPIYRVVLRGEA